MANNPETTKHDVAQTAEVREKPESKEAADAGYSSAEQARAATELAKMYQAHKKIDTELAGRAREMLKTMVDSGGDLDLEAVKAIVNEAQRRYDEADAEVVKAEGTLHGAPDETTFFKVEPKEAGNELPLASDDDVTETTAKVVKPVAQKFVPPPLPDAYARVPSTDELLGPSVNEVAPRTVASTTQETRTPSVERQALAQQRVEALRLRDVIQVRLRTADSVQRSRLENQQKEADTLLAQIDAKLKKAA